MSTGALQAVDPDKIARLEQLLSSLPDETDVVVVERAG